MAGAERNDKPEWAERQGRLGFADYVQPDDGAKAILMVCVDVLKHVQDDVMLLGQDLSSAPAPVYLDAAPLCVWLWCADDGMFGYDRPCRLGSGRDCDERVGLRTVDQQYRFASTVVCAARRLRRGRAAAIGLASVPSVRRPVTTRRRPVDHRSFSAFVVARSLASQVSPGVTCTRLRLRGRAA